MDPPEKSAREYLTTEKLSEKAGISTSTLRRLKTQGLIAFFQPAGPGTALRFPADAIERLCQTGADLAPSAAPKPLPGPKPKWARS